MTTGYKITELFRTVRLKWAEPTVTGAKRKGKAQKLLAQDIALPFIHIFDNSQHLTFAEEIVKSCFESCISWT